MVRFFSIGLLPNFRPRLIAVGGWLLCALMLRAWPVMAAEAVDFRRDVWPILERRCLDCHGPEKQKSSFRVDSRAALLKGGELGSAVVPSDAANSYLLKLVAEGDGDLRMPPEGERLTAAEVAKLREWIATGAVWPEGDAKPVAVVKHWAFQPLVCPKIPAWVGSEKISDNPIDAFIVERLAVKGLRISEAAEAGALIRRVTLDLTGLPPTPSEVSEFVRKVGSSENKIWESEAYRELVDRLLASPRYGERWAQHWLDVIRYADTTGYEKNGIRPNAWPYRDYVISAFNADTPYPRFILEQLAGDTLGMDPATGFLVTPPFPSRIEVGQEVAAIAQARYNGLDEVVQNVGSAMLGMTIGCARCHDHKFDPVSARDYYRLAANFSGLQFVDRPWRAGAKPDEGIAAAERPLNEVRSKLRGFSSWRENEPIRSADNFPAVRAKFVRITVVSTVQRYPAAFDEVEVWTPASEGQPARNVGSAASGAVARSSGVDEEVGGRDEHINDGQRGRESLWIGTNKAGRGKGFAVGENWVEIELPEPTMVNRVVWSCDHDDQGPDVVPLRWRYATNWTVEVGDEKREWQTVVAADRKIGLGEKERAARGRLEKEYADAATELWDWKNIFAGRFRQEAEAMHVLRRGDPLQPRELIGPGGVDVLGGYESPPDAAEAERRVALAKWLGSNDHPLTARVLVNRVWRHHFGAGLVETPSDFGTQGERPSHPELLDWLASRFMADGWRMKDLHRLICTSAAYCQSSRPNNAALQIDADSRLLWRFPPRRLEAEAIRDSMLQASGALDLKMGGPGVSIFRPRANDGMRGEWEPREELGPETWRRTIYLLRVRGSDDGVFKPFDVPDCGQVRAKRSVSTTPLQALNLINSPLVIAQAARLAERVAREAGNDVGRQIERAFLLTLARQPEAGERTSCVAVAEEHGLATVCRVLFNSNEFLFLQ